jgi:hypothetical protein
MNINDLTLPLKGSCHCGNVKFEVNTKLKDLRRCNCSICSRKGFVMATASSDEIKIISGETYLNKYQWNTEIAEHYFCSKCGINTHHKRRSDPNQYCYNIAFIEVFEMSCIKDAPYVYKKKLSIIKK